MLAMMHILDRIARQSLAQFRPASGLEAEDYERYEYRLTTIPSRPVILIQLLVGTIIFLGTVWLAPDYSGLISGYPISDAIVFLIFWFNMGMLVVSMYHHTRQLEMVSTLHQEAPSISIFDTTPLFAFSRLSFWAAVLTVFMILPSIFIYQTTENILFALPSIVGMGIAMFIFFLPLQSLNKRLVNEKSARLGQVKQRIRDSIHELNQGVDRGDLSYIEAQHSQLAALVLEQEYLEKLRTWPWPRGTFARLLGLIALPVLLFILQLLIQRYFPP
jgi:hypothetical protein